MFKQLRPHLQNGASATQWTRNFGSCLSIRGRQMTVRKAVIQMYLISSGVDLKIVINEFWFNTKKNLTHCIRSFGLSSSILSKLRTRKELKQRCNNKKDVNPFNIINMKVSLFAYFSFTYASKLKIALPSSLSIAIERDLTLINNITCSKYEHKLCLISPRSNNFKTALEI